MSKDKELDDIGWGLSKLSQALESFGYPGPSRFVYYREFSGGKLDGKRLFTRETVLDIEYMYSYEAGLEKTAVDRYSADEDGVYSDGKTEEGRIIFIFPYRYIDTAVSDCPLSAPRKMPWEI